MPAVSDVDVLAHSSHLSPRRHLVDDGRPSDAADRQRVVALLVGQLRVVLRRHAHRARLPCLRAWSRLDDAPVSWLRVSMGEEYAPPLRRMFRIPEGDCYGWNAGTVEAHRGRGLFVSLLEWAGWRMAACCPATCTRER